MPSIATPISHLFKNELFASIITENSDFLECRDHSPKTDVTLQALFHCDLQPIHRWTESELEYVGELKKNKPNLKLISFHLASCFHDPIIENGIFVSGSYKYSIDELKENAKTNFQKIREIMGEHVSIAIENNNYYPSIAYDYIAEPYFITSIVKENNINFLFDIAHAHVSAHNMKIPYEKYRDELPLNECIQLHICKWGKNEKMAFDAHNLPDHEEWNETDFLVKKYPRIEFLTIEYYKNTEELVSAISELKKAIL
ncbi:DUF692 family multinuclear iron-containing protein [Asinibacterium sp. OR53]|uniref:multinuclear nonheme iron-dependent oxidase n=1 Tax=Asinibacterium sp. OR53 TaxID=925409 RepID=UPI00047E38C6|nr:DUF692 family multinuclear iron-containing protein [Asinibacterium sp. OR53]